MYLFCVLKRFFRKEIGVTNVIVAPIGILSQIKDCKCPYKRSGKIMALMYYRTDVVYSLELPVIERLCLPEKLPKF